MNDYELAKSLCPKFIFHPNEKVFPCAIEDIDNIILLSKLNTGNPLYYYIDHIKEFVTYIAIYQYDLGIHNIGVHKYDIEFVRVFFDSKKQPIHYYLSEHGRDQGMYLNKIKDNKVYVAINTHAHYPYSSIWVRGFGFASDITGNGNVWAPTNFIKLDKDEFFNRFGEHHMQCFAEPEDIPGAPKNWNSLFRFLYPVSKKIRNFLN